MITELLAPTPLLAASRGWSSAVSLLGEFGC
jgi:hypothetical protein